MLTAPENKALIADAVISIEIAIALAEVIAQNDIVECQRFNQLMIYLYDAAEVLDQLRPGVIEPQIVIRTPAAHGVANPAVRLVACNDH